VYGPFAQIQLDSNRSSCWCCILLLLFFLAKGKTCCMYAVTHYMYIIEQIFKCSTQIIFKLVINDQAHVWSSEQSEGKYANHQTSIRRIQECEDVNTILINTNSLTFIFRTARRHRKPAPLLVLCLYASLALASSLALAYFISSEANKFLKKKMGRKSIGH